MHSLLIQSGPQNFKHRVAIGFRVCLVVGDKRAIAVANSSGNTIASSLMIIKASSGYLINTIYVNSHA